MGATILGEVHSSKGRADAVLWLPDAVIVFEFKYDHTAESALAQAEEKLYAGPFTNEDRPIYLVGVNYNSRERNIDEPEYKKMQRAANGLWDSIDMDVGNRIDSVS